MAIGWPRIPRAELTVDKGRTEVTVQQDPYFVHEVRVTIDTEGAEYTESLHLTNREELDNLITALTVVGNRMFPTES